MGYVIVNYDMLLWNWIFCFCSSYLLNVNFVLQICPTSSLHSTLSCYTWQEIFRCHVLCCCSLSGHCKWEASVQNMTWHLNTVILQFPLLNLNRILLCQTHISLYDLHIYVSCHIFQINFNLIYILVYLHIYASCHIFQIKLQFV